MRAIWAGEINFGMVSIPVKIYSATKDMSPSFNQLHKDCGTRISMVRRCPKCEKDLAWEEIAKGYEVEKGKYALFTKEELNAMDDENSAAGIDICQFIDPGEVGMAYVANSYWVGPGGKTSHGYHVLKMAMNASKKAGLAKVKLRSRTRLGVLRVKGNLLALDSLRFGDELVGSHELALKEDKSPSERELKLALALVQSLSGSFDPSLHPDTYRAAVLAAAEGKAQVGEKSDLESKPGKLLDLSDLLAQSLDVKGR